MAALSCCFFSSQLCFSLKIDRPRLASSTSCNKIVRRRCADSKMYGQQVVGKEVNQCTGWSFHRGSRNISRPKTGRTNILPRKSSVVYASWMQCTEIASGAFTLGTAAVLPFYTLMVVAPQAKFTKKVAGSNLPYMVLGALYGYLLYLSWTPDTIRFMFASRYWLPELSGIAKMFSSEMTLASAWIHLLAVDLYAARQVYDDGLENNIETRHSVSLCLLFCPIGILAHFITKSLTCNGREKEQGNPLIK